MATFTLSGYSFSSLNVSLTSVKAGTASLPTSACVYALMSRPVSGAKIAYIGETHNLNQRFAAHHKIDCAIREGANFICIHRDSSPSSRRRKESELIGIHNPPCND